MVFGLTGPSPGPPVSARQITKSPSTYSQKLCATVLRTISETDRKLIVCRAVFNPAVSLTIYRPLRRKTYCVSLSPKESRRMTVIEIKPHRMGWKVFEAPGVELSLVRGERFLLSRAARLYETVYEMISPSDVFGG